MCTDAKMFAIAKGPMLTRQLWFVSEAFDTKCFRVIENLWVVVNLPPIQNRDTGELLCGNNIRPQIKIQKARFI